MKYVLYDANIEFNGGKCLCVYAPNEKYMRVTN